MNMNKPLSLLFIFCFSVTTVQTAVGASLDYEKLSREQIEQLADKGNPGAQYQMGVMYVEGRRGLKQDYKEAFKWYKLAAEQDHYEARYNLGVMYYLGEGVAQDHKEAAKWFDSVANEGHEQAQNILKSMYQFPSTKKSQKSLSKNPCKPLFE